MRTLTGVDTAPEETVIVPAPVETGARNKACIPSTSIGVTSPIVVNQETGTLGIGFPYASSGIAARTTVELTSASIVAGETASEASGPGTTCTVVLPEIPPLVAVTLPLPRLPPAVNRPFESIVPKPPPVLQETVDRGTPFPFASFPAAANCRLVPAGTVPLTGLTSIRLRPPGAMRIVARPDTLPFVAATGSVPARVPAVYTARSPDTVAGVNVPRPPTEDQ